MSEFKQFPSAESFDREFAPDFAANTAAANGASFDRADFAEGSFDNAGFQNDGFGNNPLQDAFGTFEPAPVDEKGFEAAAEDGNAAAEFGFAAFNDAAPQPSFAAADFTEQFGAGAGNATGFAEQAGAPRFAEEDFES